MNSSEDPMDWIKQDISLSLDRMQQDEFSENDCRILLNDIKYLESLSEIDNTSEKTGIEDNMETAENMKDLVDRFYSEADLAKNFIMKMSAVLNEGRVPGSETVDEWKQRVEALQENYRNIREYVSNSVCEDELPEDGSPVTDYTEAYNNSRNILLNALAEKAKTVLERFISVDSAVERFARALEGFQHEALKNLQKLDLTAYESTDDISNMTADPELFLKGLEYDFDSMEDVGFEESLEAHFSKDVLLGLSRGKYIFSDQKLKDMRSASIPAESIADPSDNSETPSSTPSVPEEEPDILQEDNQKPLDTIDAEAPAAEDRVSDDHTGSDASSDTVSESVFAIKLRDKGALLSKTIKLNISSENNPAEDKSKTNSSDFKNDLRKGGKTAQTILRFVSEGCVIPNDILMDALGNKKAEFDYAVNYLLRNGYIRKYTSDSMGLGISASPRLVKALAHKDACKFLNTRQTKPENWDLSFPLAPEHIASELMMEKIIFDFKEEIDDSKPVDGWQSENSYALIYKSGSSECRWYVALGALWRDAENCDKLMRTISDALPENTIIQKLMVAGYDFTYAKALANAYLECESSVRTYSEVSLFSYVENRYQEYHYNDTETAPNDDSETGSGLTIEVNETKTVTDAKESVSPSFVNVPDELPPEVQPSGIKPTAKAKDTVRETIFNLLFKNLHYAASAYLRAVSEKDPAYRVLNKKLAYAQDDPAELCTYSTNDVFELTSDRDNFEDCLSAAIALRTFFSDQYRYDYGLKSFHDSINSVGVFSMYPNLGTVAYQLMNFKNTQKRGLEAFASYRRKNQNDYVKALESVKREAKEFYDNTILGGNRENLSHHRFLQTKKLMFGSESDIAQYIQAILKNDCDMADMLAAFLKDNFFKEGSELTECGFDQGKLWDYIEHFWYEAGKEEARSTNESLKSRLRTHMISVTTRAVQILTRWYLLVSENKEEDGSYIEYQRIKNSILNNLQNVKAEMENTLSGTSASSDLNAGLCVVLKAITDIAELMTGVCDEKKHRYYYLPFLLTDDVMLDENFIPDLNDRNTEIEKLIIETRILTHASNVHATPVDYLECLKKKLDDQTDNYGICELLVKYLEDTEEIPELSDYSSELKNGLNYAKATAYLRRDDFIGDLELAQSYGQIDSEDKKEKFLQDVYDWLEWSEETHNYGFFKKVLDTTLEDIKEKSKCREESLLQQLNTFSQIADPGISESRKKELIEKISEMISRQNYTVAEDLLSRGTLVEDEFEELFSNDFLKDFIENYEDYYNPVAAHKRFIDLVAERARNRGERGAQRLAENWLPGGSKIGKERLSALLFCLGFNVGCLGETNPIRNFDTYVVNIKGKEPGSGKIYTHPISAFGSEAETNSFRVVCVNGTYNADDLIEVMKLIGDSKHTLILLDYALSLPERRRLARKTKNALGEKLMAVLDRTVMMFLIRNYDAIKINRMLFSLVSPFGYYQPYVWQSSKSLPPELFMGRKHELEQIKSPNGANIVYGGRQLGKSALLKKAKEDIDRNENGDRAVYIEIKGLDYKNTAKKISHELFDQFILQNDIDTDDWDVLGREIRRRITSSTEERIPYFLLLLDEADSFLESCEAVNFKPFDALKEIQNVGVGRFKFVVAGLRNVVKFKKEVALGNNNVLTHLQSMTVRPFSTSEARELMEVPLQYLGLRFPKEKSYLETLILASTNYFPGLIQMYCAKLIESMRNKDYAGYDEADTPIYEISEEHIKKVLAEKDFRDQISEKFTITLKLDEDNYYDIIAVLLAYLYHANGYRNGYSVEEILDTAEELGIHKVSYLGKEKLAALLEELQELNVLRRTAEDKFLFSRFTFFQMMGTSSEIDDRIESYMEE